MDDIAAGYMALAPSLTVEIPANTDSVTRDVVAKIKFRVAAVRCLAAATASQYEYLSVGGATTGI